jgi:hypothetical protein
LVWNAQNDLTVLIFNTDVSKLQLLLPEVVLDWIFNPTSNNKIEINRFIFSKNAVFEHGNKSILTLRKLGVFF